MLRRNMSCIFYKVINEVTSQSSPKPNPNNFLGKWNFCKSLKVVLVILGHVKIYQIKLFSWLEYKLKKIKTYLILWVHPWHGKITIKMQSSTTYRQPAANKFSLLVCTPSSRCTGESRWSTGGPGWWRRCSATVPMSICAAARTQKLHSTSRPG